MFLDQFEPNKGLSTQNPKTHNVEKVYLDLRYDASGHPYFIKKNDNNKPKRPNHGHNKNH